MPWSVSALLRLCLTPHLAIGPLMRNARIKRKIVHLIHRFPFLALDRSLSSDGDDDGLAMAEEKQLEEVNTRTIGARSLP